MLGLHRWRTNKAILRGIRVIRAIRGFLLPKNFLLTATARFSSLMWPKVAQIGKNWLLRDQFDVARKRTCDD